MFKKVLLIILASALLLGMSFIPASAAPKVGDTLGNVLYSDITAYINGHAIPTSIIKGKTLVVVEDLSNYGFNVVWNGNSRTLKIEPDLNKKFTPVKVDINNKPVGSVKCHYVYTDIKTYLSGRKVESFAISGMTLIDFELLAKYGALNWDGNARTISLTIAKTSNFVPNKPENSKILSDAIGRAKSKYAEIEKFTAANSIDLNNFAGAFKTANASYKSGQYASAKTKYEEILRDCPVHMGARNNYVLTLIHLEDYNAALTESIVLGLTHPGYKGNWVNMLIPLYALGYNGVESAGALKDAGVTKNPGYNPAAAGSSSNDKIDDALLYNHVYAYMESALGAKELNAKMKEFETALLALKKKSPNDTDYSGLVAYFEGLQKIRTPRTDPPPPTTVPPTTVPPATVPPATVPPATVPPATVPPITVPPTTVPPTTVPPTTVPPTPAPSDPTPSTKETITIKGETYSTSLTKLDLSDKKLTTADIGPLKYMTNLKELNLYKNQINDISVLKNLTSLTWLNLDYNKIKSIGALKDLTNLTYLDLAINDDISDISALKKLTNLTELWLSYNQISDISALKGLTNLTTLALCSNQIKDISALKNLTKLTWLDLEENKISDISALKNLKKLTILHLAHNPVSEAQIAELQKALPKCKIS